MRRIVGLFAFALITIAEPAIVDAQIAPIFVDQGTRWTEASRTDFYSRDQGSRMIPLSWLQALKRADGQPFLADRLSRYGYIQNPASTNNLPIGFHASGPSGLQTVGMTCSACHTRQIRVAEQTYQIDGGPALVDFQGLLTDLNSAVGQVLISEAIFRLFALEVLSPTTPSEAEIAVLRQDLEAWYLRFNTLMTRALPSNSWGLGRLDAVGMIFNRLSGLDLGPPPSLLIAENIKRADAPVRYPFIWNAPKQDKTQWPGFADNGSDVLGLARNLGEVLGVFGVFEPKRQGLLFDFLNKNSANFDGLSKLEELVRQIAPPKWPWSIDPRLVAEGQNIFERAPAEGGCKQCHGISPGKVRFPRVQTWATPVMNVGTDTRSYDVLAWTAKTGVLQSAYIPFATSPLRETDLVFNILATSVIGSIAEHALSGGSGNGDAMVAAAPDIGSLTPPATIGLPRLPPALQELPGAFNLPDAVGGAPSAQMRGAESPALAPAPPKGSYEARVLEGIWAAAPYLHNGSVPTLAELLKPAAERVKQFNVGADYDIENIGLASRQSQVTHTRITTDCSDLNSGNSLCGHEYGTGLTASEKKALLEYLKTL